MSVFLIDLQKTLLVDHGGRRLLALLDHQMDKVELRALAIARELRAVDGVNHVEANPITGNVLILYSSDRIGQHEIIDALRRLGCLQEHARDQTVRGSDGGMMHGFSAKLIEAIVRSITELALQLLVSALI